MGKMTKMDKHRIARDKARRDAPFREMEALARDKSVCDEALIKKYSQTLTLAIRQKKYSVALEYCDILASYYREYDMQSRLASLKSVMMEVERQSSRQVRGRIADKVRAKAGFKTVKKAEVVAADAEVVAEA